MLNFSISITLHGDRDLGKKIMFPENTVNEYSVELLLLLCSIHKLIRIKEYLILLICLLNNITERRRKGII